MKKLVLLLLITLFFAANSSGGEQNTNRDERILSTPVDRIVGHWSNELEESFYYGKPIDGLGNYIIVSPDGDIVRHQYKIIGQYPEDDKIVVQLLLSNGDEREETYIIPKDGKELNKTTIYRGIEVMTKRYYVDGKENP